MQMEAGAKPSTRMRAKHQITTLAWDLQVRVCVFLPLPACFIRELCCMFTPIQAREFELSEKASNSRVTKAQAWSKYGW